jgi:DNA-binding transcriptional regulator YhcF (GntR family)
MQEIVMKLLTVDEYSKLKNISKQAVYKQLKSEKLISTKRDNKTLIVIEDNQIDTTELDELKSEIKELKKRNFELDLELKNSSSDNSQIEALNTKIDDLKNKLNYYKKNPKVKIKKECPENQLLLAAGAGAGAVILLLIFKYITDNFLLN